MARNPPVEQHLIPDDIRVFWISYYECWAGRSLEECIEASMKQFGVSRDEAYDEGDSYEIERSSWDETKCPNDPDERMFWKGRGRNAQVDWERTPYETLRDSIAAHATFPALLGQRE